MQVCERPFHTCSILQKKSDNVDKHRTWIHNKQKKEEEIRKSLVSDSIFHLETIYQILVHKECLQEVLDTCNSEYPLPMENGGIDIHLMERSYMSYLSKVLWTEFLTDDVRVSALSTLASPKSPTSMFEKCWYIKEHVRFPTIKLLYHLY